MKTLLESKKESFLDPKAERSLEEVIWVETLIIFHDLTAGNKFLTKEDLLKRYNIGENFKKRNLDLENLGKVMGINFLGKGESISLEDMEEIYLEAINVYNSELRSSDDVFNVPRRVKEVLKPYLSSKPKPRNKRR